MPHTSWPAPGPGAVPAGPGTAGCRPAGGRGREPAVAHSRSHAGRSPVGRHLGQLGAGPAAGEGCVVAFQPVDRVQTAVRGAETTMPHPTWARITTTTYWGGSPKERGEHRGGSRAATGGAGLAAICSLFSGNPANAPAAARVTTSISAPCCAQRPARRRWRVTGGLIREHLARTGRAAPRRSGCTGCAMAGRPARASGDGHVAPIGCSPPGRASIRTRQLSYSICWM
jgi:hypothetical protein